MKRLGLQTLRSNKLAYCGRVVVAIVNEYICKLDFTLTMTAWMNESQRQAYLRALGIQQYFPRMPVAGAKSSAPPELTSMPEIDMADLEVLDAEVEIQQAEQATVGLAREQTKPEAAPQAGELNQQQKTAEKNPAPALSVDELKFSLRYYRINDRFAVIDEIPHLQENTDQVDAITLLKSILLALDIDSSNCEFKAERLSWPLAEELSTQYDQVANAKNALLGFIKIRQEIDNFSNLLVFAGLIEELLLVQDDKTEKRDYRVGESDYFITLTSSLQSMLAFPLLKRDVWQQLQPLRHRLSSSKQHSAS